MKNIFRLSSMILAAFSINAFASDLDILTARTALALGDEYAKIATKYQQKVQNDLGYFPTALTGGEDDIPGDLKVALEQYNKYVELSKNEYTLIICETACPEPLPETGLEMPETYNFLRREAHVKFSQLSEGSNSYGTVGKYASIYAVNSNFEEHLLGKLKKLVENQQQLDSEARKISNVYTQLETSYVDLDLQVIGVDQSILKEQNYTLDTQTQISGYQGCITSENVEDDFEKDELVKSMSQLDLLQKNITNNFSKVYDFKYENEAGSDLFTVKANLGWQNTSQSFQSGDRVMLNSTGMWNVRGAVSDFEDDDLYFPPETEFPFLPGEKGWSCCKIKVKIKDVIKYAINPYSALAYDLTKKYVIPKPKALKALVDDNKLALKKIEQGLDTRPEGYYFSFSSGLTNGTSQGTSVSGGVGIEIFNIGASQSVGSSSGVSAGTGGTYGLKLNTTAMPEAAVGALIGSFCVGVPDGSTCPYFLVGNGDAIDVPSDIGAKTLWLRANDHSAHFTTNAGQIKVKIQKQTTFLTEWNQYITWFDQDCDLNGYNCGLGAILENIAYVPDPYTVAKAAFVKEFPDMTEGASLLILQEINYLVEMQLAIKDIKSKELSRELHSTKVATCKDQLANSQDKLTNTKDIISTYQRITQSLKTKEVLLDTSKRFYESELASLNNLREKNLERIRRYYALTVSSYNYLYLDDFKVETEARPYFEGDFYSSQVAIMEDLILEITTVNDLLNPNRGFVVYELSNDELRDLTNPDYRKRQGQVKLDYNDFFCQGFNLENQARVMIEKVGVLLDIDPAREHLFFKNPNRRSTQIELAHGLENRFYSFNGKEEEYWMPSQKRNVAGHSSRILVDSNSDYFQLRDSRFFERLSFRKTSFASTWQFAMTDPAIMMYDPSDTTFSNPLLKGVKLVFWYNSSEIQGENPLNQCLTAPINLAAEESKKVGSDLTWEFPVTDTDFSKIQRFTVYRSAHPERGFKPIGHIGVNSCSTEDETMSCSYNDEFESTGKFYYQVKSSYLSAGIIGSFMDGVPSNVVDITLSK